MDEKFMREAIDISMQKMQEGEGGPFGAVVVKDGEIIARGWNKVTSSNDPTAHAEMTAIREACKTLGSFQLDGCTIYSSTEPCPMCLGAIYWARPDKLYFASDRKDAANIGFDDQFIYDEMDLPITDRKLPIEQMMREESLKVFEAWDQKEDKIMY